MSNILNALPISKADLNATISAVLPKGTICWFNLTAAPAGWVICNGKYYSENGLQSSETKTEICTIPTPNLIGRYPLGATSGIGDNVEAGLPNITGKFADGLITTDSATGAVSFEDYGVFPVSGGGGYPSRRDGVISIDASLSNSIYGNSDTVTPPSINLLPCMKIRNAPVTEYFDKAYIDEVVSSSINNIVENAVNDRVDQLASQVVGIPDYLAYKSIKDDVTNGIWKATQTGYVNFRIETPNTYPSSVWLYFDDNETDGICIGQCGWLSRDSEERYSDAGVVFIEKNMHLKFNNCSIHSLNFIPGTSAENVYSKQYIDELVKNTTDDTIKSIAESKCDDYITIHNVDVNAHTSGFDHDLNIQQSLTVTNTLSTQGSEPCIYFKGPNQTITDADDRLDLGCLWFQDSTGYGQGWIDFDKYANKQELTFHVTKPNDHSISLDMAFGMFDTGYKYLNLGGATLTNAVVETPTAAQHIANKGYVDNKMVASIVQITHSGKSWCRVWSDGFIEQGGLSPASSKKIIFHRPFTTTDYTPHVVPYSSSADHIEVAVTDLTQSGMEVVCNGNHPMYWEAKGY